MLHIEALSAAYDETDVLRDIDLDVLKRLDTEMEQAEDLSQLMHEPETRANLQRAGFDPDAAQAQRTGLPGHEEGARDFAIENQEGLRRMARRMDMHYSGDYLLSAAPWLVGGAAVGGAMRAAGKGLLSTEEEKPKSLLGM